MLSEVANSRRQYSVEQISFLFWCCNVSGGTSTRDIVLVHELTCSRGTYVAWNIIVYISTIYFESQRVIEVAVPVRFLFCVV
jgi:hypothetical protein